MDVENYYAKYGLEYDPFLKNAKKIHVDTVESREVKSRLEYLQKVKGFGLLTGMPGVGKTTCIRRWTEVMNPSLYKVVYNSLSTVTVQEFYRNMALMLGAEPSYRKTDNFHKIQDEINRLALEKHITPVIIIDEADHMSGLILRDLKILFNFEMDSRDRAVILLTGQTSLNNTLRLSAHEALRQRIVMNYNMDSLSPNEVSDYILTKLKAAGCSGCIFEEAAVEAISNASAGIPRVVDRLCSKALLIADSLSELLISPETVMKVVNDCQLG